MLGFEALEKLPRRLDFPLFRVVESLPGALPGVGTGGGEVVTHTTGVRRVSERD